ncbi:hypothetical protein, partial [Achromobacter xylosoxidans]|uniref:hypothetical protein n=1 Tax=Alcaligenes xylosoxydans xylosoxydans TaxID=85698 RepID=UPI001F131815
ASWLGSGKGCPAGYSAARGAKCVVVYARPDTIQKPRKNPVFRHKADTRRASNAVIETETDRPP